MKECCLVPLSPTGLQDTEKNGLSLKQSRPLLHRGHNVSGHQEASARACLGSVGTPPSPLSPSVNGLHSSGHMSLHHLLTSGQRCHGSCPTLQRGKLRGPSPDDPEVNDLDMSGPGLKHKSSNSMPHALPASLCSTLKPTFSLSLETF